MNVMFNGAVAGAAAFTLLAVPAVAHADPAIVCGGRASSGHVSYTGCISS